MAFLAFQHGRTHRSADGPTMNAATGGACRHRTLGFSLLNFGNVEKHLHLIENDWIFKTETITAEDTRERFRQIRWLSCVKTLRIGCDKAAVVAFKKAVCVTQKRYGKQAHCV